MEKALDILVAEPPDVFNHNVEMAPRLYKKMRPEGEYSRSLSVLSKVKGMGQVPVKTGFMVGLGETDDEVHSLLKNLKNSGIDIVTIGQYLRPTRNHYPVIEYIRPEKFDFYKKEAENRGVKYVASSPYVRSSYNAEELIEALK